jgi:hypothetical protein
MENLKFKLPCGTTIWVEAFYLTWTYSGLLLGRPNSRLNQEIIESFQERVDLLWGKRKTYSLPPKLKTVGQEVVYLPPAQCAAWLTSLSSPEKKNVNKTLVVIWYGQGLGQESLAQYIRENVKDIHWDSVAVEYDL